MVKVEMAVVQPLGVVTRTGRSPSGASVATLTVSSACCSDSTRSTVDVPGPRSTVVPATSEEPRATVYMVVPGVASRMVSCSVARPRSTNSLPKATVGPLQ